MEKNISGFSFKVTFLNDYSVVGTDGFDVQVEETDYPESDKDRADSLACEWAERNLDKYGADDYEVSLENAY